MDLNTFAETVPMTVGLFGLALCAARIDSFDQRTKSPDVSNGFRNACQADVSGAMKVMPSAPGPVNTLAASDVKFGGDPVNSTRVILVLPEKA